MSNLAIRTRAEAQRDLLLMAVDTIRNLLVGYTQASPPTDRTELLEMALSAAEKAMADCAAIGETAPRRRGGR